MKHAQIRLLVLPQKLTNKTLSMGNFYENLTKFFFQETFLPQLVLS